MRQVLDLVGLLESIPFDPERSPWDVTLIEGLENGRAALYLRAHHVLTDGVGGIRLLGLLLDEPEWPRVAAKPRRGRATPKLVETGPRDGDRPRGTLTITIDVPKAVRRFMDGVNAARDVDPVDSAVRGVQRALDVANSVSRQLMVTGGPLSSRPARARCSAASRSSPSTGRGPPRSRSAGAATICWSRPPPPASAATTSELGQPTPSSAWPRRRAGAATTKRAATGSRRPVSRSRRRSGGRGRSSAWWSSGWPRRAGSRRCEVASTLAATLGRLPTRLLLPALHAQADSVDFAATALPGLRGPRHICGSLIEASYPLGPRLAAR